MSQLDLGGRELYALVVELLLDEPLSKRCTVAETEFEKIVVRQVLLEEVKGFPIESFLVILHDVLELLCNRIVAVLDNALNFLLFHA